MNADLGLLTDLYQISMAYGYWKNGMADRKAIFNLYFRKSPYNGRYAIACGLEQIIKYIEAQKEFWLSSPDMNYLWTLTGNDGNKLFSREFINFLGAMEFSLTIDAIPEGTVVFPNEPLLRVSGPLYQCQLLESILLNQINFSTLIATKAHRIVQAAGGDPVIDFGLRRAQGMDGALTASRAAYIGGCIGTSNVLAGRKFGIPVKGTTAHSWVMSFDSEQEAMDKWVESMPNNSTLLVDTYDTVKGITHAINAGERLRKSGHDLSAIRLDSGDLLYESRLARRMLNEAGFNNTKIVVSNDLDELEIIKLKAHKAPIDIWGVGTNLITGGDQSALGGVYKMSAIEDKNGKLRDTVKISSEAVKTSLPGLLNVRRFNDIRGKAHQDYIYDERYVNEEFHNLHFKQLLVPIYNNGKLVYNSPTLDDIKKNVFNSWNEVDLDNNFKYPVQIDDTLLHRQQVIIKDLLK